MTRPAFLARGFGPLAFAVTVALSAAATVLLLHRYDPDSRAAPRAAAHPAARRFAATPADSLSELATSALPDETRQGRVFEWRDKTLRNIHSETESFAAGTSELPKFKVEFVHMPMAMPDGTVHTVSLALDEVGVQGGPSPNTAAFRPHHTNGEFHES